MLIADIKLGMKLRIKSAAKLCKKYNKSSVRYVLNFARDGGMDKYCGKTCTIDNIDTNYNVVKIDIDGNQYYWRPSVFELPTRKISLKGILCK